jgi:hypothetical protein
MKLFESKYGTFRYNLILDEYRIKDSSIYWSYWNSEEDQYDFILKKNIQVWLRDIIGDNNYRIWDGELSFIKKEDAMLFKLSWG